jgi:2,4-dienoyl-CoA reductase-like NADH-dependent reductase (Old Yellow Enzyme family)
MSQLASPLTLPNGVTLKNRLAKSAMSEVLADPADHAPNDALVRLYERWGKSGAGLLITGHVIVDEGGLGEPGNVVVVDDRHRAGLTRWANAGQAHGAQLWMQINHTGRQAPRRLIKQPVAPSAVGLKGMGGLFAKPRALTDREITDLVGRFATTAAAAKDAGFAGVQIHAAHGYLISQFLSPLVNQRDDAWGGDPARRSRFLLEIVRAVRGAVGAAFPIGVKLNSADFQRGGFTVDDAMDVVRGLEAAGLDLLEISGGNYESPAMAGSGEMQRQQRASSRDREAYFLDYAKQIRTVTKLPILLTGGMRSRATMEQAIASGAVDVIGMARPMAYTPDLPGRLLDGSLAAAPVVKLRSRIRLVDDIVQVMWFQQQITAMGHGRDPDPTLGVWAAFWRGIRGNMLRGKPARPASTPALAPEAEAR